MGDEHNEQDSRTLRQEALKRLPQGKDSWNAWAEAHVSVELDFSNYHGFSDQDFSGFIFPGRVTFSGSKLSGHTSFENSEFRGEVDFSKTTFSKGANFVDAHFYGDTNFSFSNFGDGGSNFCRSQFHVGYVNFSDATMGKDKTDFISAKFFNDITFFSRTNFSGSITAFRRTLFSGDCTFRGAHFDNGNVTIIDAEFHRHSNFSGASFNFPLNIEGAVFKQVPDFRRTKLAAHFTFHNVSVEFPSVLIPDKTNNFGEINDVQKQKGAKNIEEEDNTNKEPVSDKYRRLKDLALLAKDHEKEQEFFANELRAKRFNKYRNQGSVSHWILAYDWTSDFGRSVIQPLSWLGGTWIIFGTGYWLSAMFFPLDPTKSLSSGLKLSAAILTPFTATSRRTFAKNGALEQLFGIDPSLWFHIFATIEGFLGIAFLFLIGLALRNRFRI